jgi:hypothetical protein
MISYPFHLLECCLVRTAGAVVLGAEAAA